MLWFVGLSLAFSWTSLAVLAHGTFNGWYEAAVRWLAPEVRQGFMSFSALLTAVLALVAVWRCGSTHLSSRTCHIWPT